jgi:transposase
MEFTKDFFNLLLDFGDDWAITKVETNHKEQKVYLYLEYVSDSYEDPDTLEPASLYDHTELREWRHLDILQYQCYVRCKIPRVRNKSGKVKQIALGWAGKHDRHTYHFEIKIIDLLIATKNQTKTAEFMNCSFRMVNRIMHRSVERGMLRREVSKVPFEHISIDEKSFKKGHKYVTVLSHPKSGVVLDVGEGRDESSVQELLTNTFTPKQLKSINTVSMDMWQAFINTVHKQCPNAEIVHDKFHLIAYLNKSLDQVRRREVKDNKELIGSRYAILKNEKNLTQKQKEKFDLIKSANFEVSKVWHIRENFKELFELYNEEKSALALFVNWAQDSFMQNIKEVNKVIMMFLNHAKGVVNALVTNLNNAMAERLNGKIQEIKTIGKGYRTFLNFKSAILFFHGGLDLYPLKW